MDLIFYYHHSFHHRIWELDTCLQCNLFGIGTSFDHLHLRILHHFDKIQYMNQTDIVCPKNRCNNRTAVYLIVSRNHRFHYNNHHIYYPRICDLCIRSDTRNSFYQSFSCTLPHYYILNHRISHNVYPWNQLDKYNFQLHLDLLCM